MQLRWNFVMLTNIFLSDPAAVGQLERAQDTVRLPSCAELSRVWDLCQATQDRTGQDRTGQDRTGFTCLVAVTPHVLFREGGSETGR